MSSFCDPDSHCAGVWNLHAAESGVQKAGSLGTAPGGTGTCGGASFYPIIFLTDGLSNLLARVFGVDPLSDTDDVTEEEIISMVNEGHEQGVLLASEAEMIHNIFEFGDKEAKDIMTHRKNICALDGTRTFRQALEFIKENNYSRFPVFLDDIDNIIGVLHIKEALELSLDAAVYDTPVSKIKGLIREVDFIPRRATSIPCLP